MGSCCGLCRSNEIALAKDRLTRVALTPSDPLKIIEGYEKEPFVSLEDALRLFQGKIKNLSEQIVEAKRHCRQLSEHGLTSDQAAAIYLYSMKLHSNSVYYHLHRAWLSNDRSEMKPWLKYFHLFYSGLNKLPDVKTEIWQGIPYSEQWAKRLQSTSFPVYSYLGSCSPSLELVKDYLREKGGSKVILIGYENLKAKDATGYTHGDFREAFLQPGFTVVKSHQTKILENGSMIFRFSDKGSQYFFGSSSHFVPWQISRLGSFVIDEFSSGSSTPHIIKHFVCRNKPCGHRCPGNHENRHCIGADVLRHICSHHCGPINNCSRCDKEHVGLRQCKKCNQRFCENCCMK